MVGCWKCRVVGKKCGYRLRGRKPRLETLLFSWCAVLWPTTCRDMHVQQDGAGWKVGLVASIGEVA